MKIEELEKRVILKANNYLFPQGFTSEKPCLYIKKLSFGFDEISFSLTPKGMDKGIHYLILRGYKAIEKYWEKYFTELRGYPLEGHLMTIGTHAMCIDKKYNKYPDDAILGNGGELLRMEYSIEDLKRFFEDFQWHYENLLQPVLIKSQDIRWLDKKLNTDPLKFNGFTEIMAMGFSTEFHKLIIARLAGNPNYEQIYQLIRGTLVEWATEEEDGKRMLRVFDKVYEDLKEVKPLENPILE